MLTSSIVVFLGLGLGWWVYGNRSPQPGEPDALERSAPWLWTGCTTASTGRVLRRDVDAFYGWWARVADWVDRRVWAALWPWWRDSGCGRSSTILDVNWVDGGFDKACEELTTAAD